MVHRAFSSKQSELHINHIKYFKLFFIISSLISSNASSSATVDIIKAYSKKMYLKLIAE